MKTLTILTLLLSATNAKGQADSCSNASPFTWYACEEYDSPYPQTATLCYTFTTNGTSVNFDFGYFAFCPDLTVTYTLYSAACDSIMSNATGAFAIASGVQYVVCGTVACGSPGGIREVCTTEQMTLPVELVGLTAYAFDGGVLIEWRTATERNARSFAILRSPDLVEWSVLVQVPASGDSYTAKVYRWTDAAPVPGMVYYQLKGVDFDGRETMLGYLPVHWTRPGGSSLGPFDLLGRRIK